MGDKIVIGIDGGGTNTRYMAVNLKGHVLAYLETGSSRTINNPEAAEMVKGTVRGLIVEAGCEPSDVVELVAGFADVTWEGDTKPTENYTNLPELKCNQIHLNDVDIALAGITLGKPGIVVSGGTNFTGMAVTEKGKRIHAYSVPLFMGTSAWQLSMYAIHEIVTGFHGEADKVFVKQILDYWNVKTPNEIMVPFVGYDWYMNDSGMKLRQMAPLVTEAAKQGIPSACRICDRTISDIERDIRILGSYFDKEDVTYGLAGSVICAEYIRRGIEEKLTHPTNKKYQSAEAPLSATAGAVFLALEKAGIQCDGAVIDTLRRHPKAIL